MSWVRLQHELLAGLAVSKPWWRHQWKRWRAENDDLRDCKGKEIPAEGFRAPPDVLQYWNHYWPHIGWFARRPSQELPKRVGECRVVPSIPVRFAKPRQRLLLVFCRHVSLVVLGRGRFPRTYIPRDIKVLISGNRHWMRESAKSIEGGSLAKKLGHCSVLVSRDDGTTRPTSGWRRVMMVPPVSRCHPTIRGMSRYPPRLHQQSSAGLDTRIVCHFDGSSRRTLPSPSSRTRCSHSTSEPSTRYGSCFYPHQYMTRTRQTLPNRISPSSSRVVWDYRPLELDWPCRSWE